MLPFALALLLVSCNDVTTDPDINRPLANAQIRTSRNFDQIRPIVVAFAEQDHFAVQPIISRPQGDVTFSMRLFRDDVSVMITGLQGSDIRVAAYPLCACQLKRRVGLQNAADAAVNDLKERLSQ